MNRQRFALAALALFVFLAGYDWLVHGQLMMPLYTQTPNLWRSDADMQALLGGHLAVTLAMAALITYMFVQHYQNRGIAEGARFGLYIGALLGLLQFSAYFYLPISLQLGLTWFFVYLIQGLGAGIVLSLLYRR